MAKWVKNKLGKYEKIHPIINYLLPYKLKQGIDFEKLNWNSLSKNPNAIDLLLKNPKKIVWDSLSSNCNTIAIDLLRDNPDKISWNDLSRNPNPNAIDILRLSEATNYSRFL